MRREKWKSEGRVKREWKKGKREERREKGNGKGDAARERRDDERRDRWVLHCTCSFYQMKK